MPDGWSIRVRRLQRYGLPWVGVKLADWLETGMVVSSGEPISSIAPEVARQLELGASPRPGRLVVPSDSGPVIARRLPVRNLSLQTVSGAWLDLGPMRLAVTFRPQALGVGGLIAVDVLGRFQQITYRLGPPDTLLLEEHGGR